MPRRPSPKRAAVIDAATQLFLTHGFSGTSMDRIAAEANVSKRTVYDHFPSKDDLFQAIADRTMDEVDKMPGHAYSPDVDVFDQLLAIGETFAATITSPAFLRLTRVVVARFIQSREWGVHSHKAHARLRRDMTAFFVAATADGRLDVQQPDFAATQFCGLIKEVAFWPVLTAGQAPLTDAERSLAVRSAVELFVAGYRVAEAPA
ncbi:MAG: TetR/AcrR family transcriptional regulator [Planctomycetota bacterium]